MRCWLVKQPDGGAVVMPWEYRWIVSPNLTPSELRASMRYLDRLFEGMSPAERNHYTRERLSFFERLARELYRAGWLEDDGIDPDLT